MTRYECTEVTQPGATLLFYTDSLKAALDLTTRMGGRWRIRRQYRRSYPAWMNESRWTKDGKRSDRWVGFP